jgi:hypothetical protein
MMKPITFIYIPAPNHKEPPKNMNLKQSNVHLKYFDTCAFQAQRLSCAPHLKRCKNDRTTTHNFW